MNCSLCPNKKQNSSKPKCAGCYKAIAKNHSEVCCDQCQYHYHIKCGYVTVKGYCLIQRGWISTKCLFSVLPNAEACFSDTDLDVDIITVPDQGESGITLNTSTGSKLLSAARQKNVKGILLSPQYKQYSEKS